MSAAIVAMTRPSSERARTATKAPVAGMILVSGPIRDPQKQRQTEAPA